MALEKIDLDMLKTRLRGIRASMSRALWSEWLVDIAAALLVEDSGYIIDETKPADAMFGYIPGELVGEPLRTLIPKRFWDMHDQHWSRYWEHPIARAMGSQPSTLARPAPKLDIIGVMKDGTEKNLTIGLYPFKLAESRVAIALISERF